MKAIRIVTGANGMPTPHDGRYLFSYNPDTVYGDLAMVSTPDLGKARRFTDLSAAHDLWAAVSQRQPVRPDGRPNRPITGLTVEIIEIIDVVAQQKVRK